MRTPPIFRNLFSRFVGVAVFTLLVGGSAFGEKATNSFPAPFQDYRILDGGLSKDKRFALIYPKQNVFDDPNNWSMGLFLVSMEPFRVLTQIPIPDVIVKGSGSYSLNWYTDSSFILEDDSKWGARGVFLGMVGKDETVKIIELSQEVRKALTQTFNESHAPKFNDQVDFIFVNNGQTRWFLGNKNEVQIDCICTTDPKDLKKDAWTVRFQGVWDISKGDFTSRTITRLPKVLYYFPNAK